ncbi:MAG: class II aldolase/adducin family protein [Nanoarchaeota archaeon]|nr:class II aldolase/adducin family protein [Nanoarchaeota archaeon]MBU1028412.1 class II aldolase/adducin family protein [Nanoarchaeota archaeon]
MTYEGVKFQTEMIGKDLPNDSRLKKLKYWCQVFHEKNLAPPYDGGSYGNLSFRLEDGQDKFIITASSSGLNESNTNDRFVTIQRIDLEAAIVYASGSRKPSSEAMVHAAIYHARSDVNAVFHGHCDRISKDAEKLGIPITSREEPYGTTQLVDRVLETLGDNYFLEMRNHGFLALGKSLDDAGNLALESLKKC